MFSDESRFSLQSDSRRTLIWRAPGTRYHQENTIQRHRYGGAGWLVWGGIILGSRTDLHVQSVTMTGHIYRDVIVEQHVRLFRGAKGAEFLFMDDNARPHRANIVDECLQSEDITRMDWPAYSPDLNPIEHVWDILGRRIAARQPPPTFPPDLRRALLNEWCNIPEDQIDNLILSMPRHYSLFPSLDATRNYFQLLCACKFNRWKGAFGSSGIIRQVTGISNFRFRIFVQHPENDPKSTFHAPRFLRNVPVTVPVIDNRPELSGKVATISHIGYQIQIARLKIRQGSSFHAPRLLRFGSILTTHMLDVTEHCHLLTNLELQYLVHISSSGYRTSVKDMLPGKLFVRFLLKPLKHCRRNKIFHGLGKAVTSKCLGGPPVHRDRRNAYSGYRATKERRMKNDEFLIPVK
ncbi:transposable element Tc3 transposase [Trichonephila clavipes]|nr:transposable element Tc3 transposase [Trichonephila clavipes]